MDPSALAAELGRVATDGAPLGLAVTRPDATVEWCNAEAAALVGLTPAELVGRNLLDFADEPLDRLTEMISYGNDYDHTIMGPLRVSYRRADGIGCEAHAWSVNRVAVDDEPGFVVALTPDWCGFDVTRALTAIVDGAPIDDTLAFLARATSGHPINSPSCWLLDEQSRGTGPSTVSDDIRDAIAAGGPWWDVLSGVRVIEGPVIAEDHPLLAGAGFHAWWVACVRDADHGLLVLRRQDTRLSPNQREHLDQIVTVAALAFERSATEAELQYRATHDPLTGVANRSMLFGSPRDLVDAALLYIDLDDFKPVNDRLGHAVGDEVLVAVARRITSVVREQDDVARVGGDEFVVECNHVTDRRTAELLADRILESLRLPVGVGPHMVEVNASIGIAFTRAETPTLSLLERADLALRAAKQRGRGQWVVAD